MLKKKKKEKEKENKSFQFDNQKKKKFMNKTLGQALWRCQSERVLLID